MKHFSKLLIAILMTSICTACTEATVVTWISGRESTIAAELGKQVWQNLLQQVKSIWSWNTLVFLSVALIVAVIVALIIGHTEE